jgi:hypothetical protein
VTLLEDALADAGGPAAPRERHAQLRAALAAALDRGRDELARPRSGYDEPVEVAVATVDGALVGVAPVAAALRADPAAAGERAQMVAVAVAGALAQAADAGPPASAADLALTLSELDGHLALALETRAPDAELAALAFDEAAAHVDRLRARARVVPCALLGGLAPWRAPIGAQHLLHAAEAIARLGGCPTDPESVARHEDAVGALLEPESAGPAPHDEPDPALRVARRILKRLRGMGKWGGYHTAFDHVARGFAGHERELAYAVGERLLAAGLLAEKQSVGQRHVFLDPRRAADIHALVDHGRVPRELTLT